MMQAPPSWRSQTYLQHSAPRPAGPFLHSHPSLYGLNTHSSSWYDLHIERSSSSSSPSSTSSVSTTRASSPSGPVFEHAIPDFRENYSRSRRGRFPLTQANNSPITFKTNSFTAPQPEPTKNPWANAMNRRSPSVSPRSSPPSSYSPPQDLSRAATPLAPIPLRPILGQAHFHPLPYDNVDYPSSDRSTPTLPDIYTPAPSQPDLFALGTFSNGHIDRIPAQPDFFAPDHDDNSRIERILAQTVPYSPDSPRSSDMDRLPVQFITTALERQYSLSLIKLVNSKRWGVTISGLVHHWLLREPKTALLFWMCDEVDALPKAANVYQLKDKNLPYKEEDLINIVLDPPRVVKTQWKAVMKQLPRGGQHVEFQTRDEIPLAMLGDIGPHTSSSTKTLHKVRYLDGSDTAMYVRKRLVINYDRAQDRNVILAQIRAFHKLEHKNIANIVSSYIRGCTIAFVTPNFDSNLEEYMDAISGFSQSELLLGWTQDLASALTYIHANDMEHKNIRPQKILIDSNDRIFFSVFGVCPPVRSSYAQLYEPYSNNPSYIYAAPEVVSGDIALGNVPVDSTVDVHARGKARARQTDVYSLGCILFELAAKAKGRTMKEIRDYRSFETHDNSFHMNLDRVYLMVDQLKTVPLSTSASRRQRIEDGSKRVLEVIKRMLNADPSNRPAIHKVLNHLRKPLKPRRTSFDVTLASEFKGSQQRGLESLMPSQSAVWGELQSLQPHYDRPQGYGQSHYEYPGQAYYAER